MLNCDDRFVTTGVFKIETSAEEEWDEKINKK
jgi:hypothetical protein